MERQCRGRWRAARSAPPSLRSNNTCCAATPAEYSARYHFCLISLCARFFTSALLSDRASHRQGLGVRCAGAFVWAIVPDLRTLAFSMACVLARERADEV